MMGYALVNRSQQMKGLIFGLSKAWFIKYCWPASASRNYAIVPAMQRPDGSIKIVG